MTSSYTPQSPFQETLLRGLVILVTLQERKDASFSSKSFFANFREFYKGMFQNTTATALDRFGSNTVAATFEINLNITFPKFDWVLSEVVNLKTANIQINGQTFSQATFTHNEDFPNNKRVRYRSNTNNRNVTISKNNKVVINGLGRGNTSKSFRVRSIIKNSNIFTIFYSVLVPPNVNNNQAIIIAPRQIQIWVKTRIN